MPKGKGFAKLEIDSESQIMYASHTGGGINRVYVDRPHPEKPNTMVKEQSGGEEYEDLEIEISESELAEEIAGQSFMDSWQFFKDWENSNERKSVAIVWYKDTAFQDVDKTFEYQKAIPKVSMPEGQRESGDARVFKVTIMHQGLPE